jgi:hypothetical protein
MAREPKVMWSARLTGGLVDQIVEAAEEEGVSQGELVELAMGEWLDARSGEQRPFVSLADSAARAGLARVEAYSAARGARPVKVLVGCMFGDDEGVVVGAHADPADQVDLAADSVEFATIAAAAGGKRLRVYMDGGCK